MDIGLAAGLWALTMISIVVPGTTGTTIRHASVFAFVIGTIGTVPLVWRRRWPVAVLMVTLAATLVSQWLHQPDSTLSLSPVVAAYSVGAYVGSRRALRLTAWLLLGLLAVGNTIGAIASRKAEDLLSAVGNAIVFGTALLAGDNVRRRRERIADLEARAEAQETTRQVLAREAVTAERQRIARELHDVVAHSLSVMVVQAGAARRLVATKPDRATEALTAIETTGRQALDEMRRLLGVLRTEPDDGGVLDLSPQPTVAGIASLAAADPTLAVDVTVEGDPVPLPAAVDLQAYRIVQEALTNVRKHAGPARARVHLRYGVDSIEVRVDDDGRGASADPHHDGHGLVGMRERAALCGGELRVGPRPGGGWTVAANLPLAGPRAGVA